MHVTLCPRGGYMCVLAFPTPCYIGSIFRIYLLINFPSTFLLVLKSLSVLLKGECAGELQACTKAQGFGVWMSAELLALLTLGFLRKPESCLLIPQRLPRSCQVWADGSDPSWHQHQLPSIQCQWQNLSATLLALYCLLDGTCDDTHHTVSLANTKHHGP